MLLWWLLSQLHGVFYLESWNKSAYLTVTIRLRVPNVCFRAGPGEELGQMRCYSLSLSPPELTATQPFSMSPQLSALSPEPPPAWWQPASPGIAKHPGAVFMQYTGRYLSSPLVAHCHRKLAWATEVPVRLELGHPVISPSWYSGAGNCTLRLGTQSLPTTSPGQRLRIRKRQLALSSIYLEKHLEAKLIGLQSSSIEWFSFQFMHTGSIPGPGLGRV